MDQPEDLSKQGAGGLEVTSLRDDPAEPGAEDPGAGGGPVQFAEPPDVPRDVNGSARVAATIASLSTSLENWKADMARSSARGEERLFRALEILESRLGQNQATANEIRDSVTASAAWLTRALEEWKAEFRYGTGLSEVRLLSAIEALEARVGQVEYAENQTRLQLEQATTEIGRNLEDRLETVKAGQDETRGWLEAAATALANDAQSALGRLRDLRTSIDGFRGEMRLSFADAHSFANESRLSLAARFNEILTTISSIASASADDRAKLRSEIAANKDELVMALAAGVTDLRLGGENRHGELREILDRLKEEIVQAATSGLSTSQEEIASLRTAVESWRSAVGESASKTEARMLRALEALEKGILDTRDLEAQISEQIGGFNSGFSEKLGELDAKIASTIDARLEPVTSATTEYRSSFEGLASNLQSALQEWRDQSTAASAGTEAKLVAALEALESRMSAVGDSRREVEEQLLARIDEIQTRADSTGTEAKIVAALEALESRISAVGESGHEVEAQLLERLEGVQQRVAQINDDIDLRQRRLETSLNDLMASIDDWRAKGRDAAQKRKDRIALGLQALESRIVEGQEEEQDHRTALFKELNGLYDAVERLSGDGKSYDRVMQGLEELDQELLRNRDDLSKLADTFESQFEIFENRVGRAVSSRVEQLERSIEDRFERRIGEILQNRLDALERIIEDRIKAYAPPISASAAEADEDAAARILRATSDQYKTENDSPAGQQRRRRR